MQIEVEQDKGPSEGKARGGRGEAGKRRQRTENRGQKAELTTDHGLLTNAECGMRGEGGCRKPQHNGMRGAVRGIDTKDRAGYGYPRWGVSPETT